MAEEGSKSRISEFINRYSAVKAIVNFCTHPTTWRVIAIGLATATTIMSGGATVPLIGLATTFGTSLIAVVAKTVQVRRLEKLNIQHSLISRIAEMDKTIRDNPQYSKVIGALREKEVGLELKPIHEIKTTPPSKLGSFLRTIRDIGLENIAPVAIASVTFNAPGLVAFVGSMAWGITRISAVSALGGRGVYSEFKERQINDLLEHKRKEDITALCKQVNIPPYETIQGLQSICMRKAMQLKAVERICDIVKRHDDLDIPKAYDRLQNACEVTIKGVPEDVSMLKAAWYTIRPWGEKFKSQDYEAMKDQIAFTVIERKTATPLSSSARSKNLRPDQTPIQSQQHKSGGIKK